MKLFRLCVSSVAFALFATTAYTQDACSVVTAALGASVRDVECTFSSNLTTANTSTTPPDNSRLGLPPSAFTPRGDAAAVSPDAPHRTPLTQEAPGLQITGGMVEDADARWVLRLPERWNGKVVVGVPGGTRSEYMGDYIFSDFVVQRGYAYASTNKGTLNFSFAPVGDDVTGCRLVTRTYPIPAVRQTRVFFYLAEKKDSIVEWFQRTREVTALAKSAAVAYGLRAVEKTYLFGISNGGHVTRRLLEESPEMYDGGVDWEGVYWAPPGPNILIDLPAALRPYLPYSEAGFNTASPEHQAIVDAGYPPDIRSDPVTPTAFGLNGWFYETHANNYWDVTTCLYAKELDPSYSGLPEHYDYLARRKSAKLSPNIGKISTSGDIQRPMLTIHGTMDALLPIKRHARPYRDAVVEAGKGGMHRLYEVQNGNHIERFGQSAFNFRQLELLQPHAHNAFGLLVDWVEGGKPPPPSQCVPRGGKIEAFPVTDGRPERCEKLLAP
jgi:pimeloyl-ACP methyl ester carboxylesterase